MEWTQHAWIRPEKNERRSSAYIQMFRDDNVGKQEYDKCPTE